MSARPPSLMVDGLTTALAGSGISILDNVSFALRPGEVLGVVGESGLRQEHAGARADGPSAPGGPRKPPGTSCSREKISPTLTPRLGGASAGGISR